jgi:multidrug resistance efflux pump
MMLVSSSKSYTLQSKDDITLDYSFLKGDSMPKNKFTILLLMIAIALAAAACAQSPTPETGQGVDIPIVVDDFAVVAEGRLVPADTVRLAFVTGGRVAEILVEEGDTVQAGSCCFRGRTGTVGG